MIAITYNERIAEAEAGFNVVLGLLITGNATLPDPTFRTRLQMRSFTRDDFRHLYGQEVGGSPDPEYSLLFQSCINARYFTVVNWPGSEIVMMSEDLIWSYRNGTMRLGLFGAAAFPPWIRSKLVHLHLSRDQGSGFLFGPRGDVVLTAKHCVNNAELLKFQCEDTELQQLEIKIHRKLEVAKIKIAPVGRQGLILGGPAVEMTELYVAGYPRLGILTSPCPVFGSGYVAAAVTERGMASYIVSTPTPGNPGNSGGPVTDKYGRIVALIERDGSPSDDTERSAYSPYLYATALAGLDIDDESQWADPPPL